jgi:hypothetical protein
VTWRNNGTRSSRAKEFLDYRRKLPTPHTQRLHFRRGDRPTADPDEPVPTEADLEAAREG